MLGKPLKKMLMTQPFGVDWVGDGYYASCGMRGHNGIDLSAAVGTPVYAAMDGICWLDSEKAMGAGYGNALRQRNADVGLEAIYGHLSGFAVAPGEFAKKGQLIAYSGNTGKSTGPHLHFGVREIHYVNGAGPYYDGYDNGYLGYVDPMPLFDLDAFALPVDLGYGLSRPLMSEIEWLKTSAWFWNEIRKVEGKRRLATVRERSAVRYGAWDFRSLVDPAMFGTWTEMTKMEWLKRKAEAAKR